MINNVLNYCEEFQQYYQKLRQAEESKTDSFEYKVGRVFSSYKEMFERFCPYKEGETVVLTKALEIEKGSGWYGSKHFLVFGAKAVVVTRDFDKGKFIFGLEFENETWVDIKGCLHPVEEKHVFTIREDYLEKFSR